MYDLTEFKVSDMSRCGAALRSLGANAASMEEMAVRVVRFLYHSIASRTTGERSSALVRFYKTHPYGDLDPERQAFADAIMPDLPKDATTKCLTLLATAG